MNYKLLMYLKQLNIGIAKVVKLTLHRRER